MNMKTKIITLLILAMVEFSAAQTQGTLTVSTSTSATVGANYDPNNIVAIWVVNSSGVFVKSLLVDAGIRQQYLYTWIASNSSLNKVDATTGATGTFHGTITCSWNGKNVSEVVVPDGTYTVKMELTDKHSQGNLGSFAFAKGTAAQNLIPADVPSFSNNSIKWAPAVNTAVEEVKLSNLYQVYPNPTSSSIYVNGLNIKEIEILTPYGKSVMKTNLQNINLSNLPKGIYMIKINSANGTIVKKLIKE